MPDRTATPISAVSVTSSRGIEVTGVLRFGDFVLNPDSRELSRDGRPIALSPKAFQLLEMLVESCPTALSKHALQERLWPDTFVVEKNLVNIVVEVRQALGDDPAQPRFIRTVHRFGYAFRQTPDNPGNVPPAPAGPIRCRLLWADRRVALRDGEHVVGRDPELELFLDAPGVSRRHALIKIKGDEATVEDLGSKTAHSWRTRAFRHRPDWSIRKSSTWVQSG
jgi:DNA-binding winged helix-turn-helix (wHTH) protein